jgi:hypothetical protein
MIDAEALTLLLPDSLKLVGQLLAALQHEVAEVRQELHEIERRLLVLECQRSVLFGVSPSPTDWRPLQTADMIQWWCGDVCTTAGGTP